MECRSTAAKSTTWEARGGGRGGGGREGGQGEQGFGNEELDHLAELEGVARPGGVVAERALAEAVAGAVRVEVEEVGGDGGESC